jgi:hypothetical protein
MKGEHNSEVLPYPYVHISFADIIYQRMFIYLTLINTGLISTSLHETEKEFCRKKDIPISETGHGGPYGCET